jgi:hypothetical protein
VTDFKAGDRVKVTMARSFEGEVVDWPNAPSGLAVRAAGGSLYWMPQTTNSEGFDFTFELIAPAEPPVGSVIVSSGRCTWERAPGGWYAVGVTQRYDWEEVSTYGPFTVLREGWGE